MFTITSLIFDGVGLFLVPNWYQMADPRDRYVPVIPFTVHYTPHVGS